MAKEIYKFLHTDPLHLLNGNEVAQILARRRTQVGQVISGQESSADRLVDLFLTIYSAYPDENEIANLRPLCEDEESCRTLARAMLSSNRFLFVQ